MFDFSIFIVTFIKLGGNLSVLYKYIKYYTNFYIWFVPLDKFVFKLFNNSKIENSDHINNKEILKMHYKCNVTGNFPNFLVNI